MKTYTGVGKSNNGEDELLQVQRETFVASLSHDLKNPTIAQIRAIELLLKGKFGQILPQQKEIMEMLLDSCKYMNAMLGNILSTYRNLKGIINLASEEVSISSFAKECIEEMIYLAKDKNIKTIIQDTAEKPIIYGDEIQLRRVVMNLLSNSIKYAYSNSELNFFIYNEQNYTCFKFENKSPYIPPEKREQIFAKYVSFSQSISNGIGLGLYASKKIVEAHGGIMFVQSFEDERNIFGFKIPNDENLKYAKRSVSF